MSLEPCKVCGTLNAAETEICLSCGYPTQGNKRPAIFRWIAIALIICFALPFLSGLINWVLLQLNPKSPSQPSPKVSIIPMTQNLSADSFNLQSKKL
ncbi:hypothetical protein [Pleurocapsa sp. FMAR1]|uniref:hypothetical protein n=1 Tax=Pleurocapsa sp. FMAR1 TaxID=3040204 RepID=UPI0029C8DFC5|nr:hypothetical protein [Pleurocapsa sp. FMAR1]